MEGTTGGRLAVLSDREEHVGLHLTPNITEGTYNFLKREYNILIT